MLFKSVLKHKWLIGIAAVILIGGTVYYVRTKKTTEPLRYVVSAATKGTLITSISGSGQVSGENQIELKPEISGTITKALVKPGDEVSTSTILFQIDPKEALKTVRDAVQSVTDARLSLASAELSLQKQQQQADALSVLQAQNSVSQAERALQKLQEGPDAFDLQQAQTDVQTQLTNSRISSDGKTSVLERDVYDQAVPTLKAIGLSIQQVFYNADSVLGIDRKGANDEFERFLSAQDSAKLSSTEALYTQARQSVKDLKAEIDALQTNNEDPENIDKAIDNAQIVLTSLDPLARGVYEVLLNTLASVNFTQSSLDALRSTAQSDRTTVSTKLTSLLSQRQSIENAKTAYTTAVSNLQKSQIALQKLQKPADASDLLAAQEKIDEAKASLAKLQKGLDPIDVATARNSIQQRRLSLVSAQNKLTDAQETLKKYTIRAPFNGIIAKVPVKLTDSVSPSTALATLLTKNKIAQLTLNEVDASKIHVGQKATLLFDALPDLTIAGELSEVDTIGTVTQGVVNYTVKISFITQDDRIKPGMTVSASIITDTRIDVLTVPNSAIQSNGTGAGVQVLLNVDPSALNNTQGITSVAPPQSKSVQIGISNDQSTEIMSGLNEGDFVVTRTIDPATQAKAATAQTGAQSSLRGIQGISGGTFGGAGGGTRPAVR